MNEEIEKNSEEYEKSDSNEVSENVDSNIELSDKLDSTEKQQDSPADDIPFSVNRMSYISFIPPDPDDDDFWGEVSTAAVRKLKPVRLIILISLALVIAAIFIYTIGLQHGKGWFTNIFSGNGHMNFTLPIAETPQLDGKYYNDDGTYTSSGIAKAALPSVVQIQAYTQNSLIPSSQGSGIIISDDGYIVTNAHVVKSADFGVTVMLYDKTEYAAKIVGSDDSTDIAVLKIGAKDLSPAQFADSDACELGDEIVTIGSPAGYENSVTKGIISGLDRKIRAENSAVSMSCIQIDAAINPGNSGGPLFNMWGQVIGITSSKLVSSSYDNIGFAISINSAKPIIEQLIENGFIPDRPRIGISYYIISKEAAEMYGTEYGVCVVDIDSECNVSKTELAPGDIIIEMNGKRAVDEKVVTELMDTLKAGDEMNLRVFRPSGKEGAPKADGEYFDISFTLNSDKTAMIESDK